MHLVFKSSIFLVVLISSVFCGWDDWVWGEPEEGVTVETTTKRFDEEGLCDHDPLTIMILKFLLETKSQMQGGNSPPGLPPLDPLSIPEMKLNLVGTDPSKYYNVDAYISEVLIEGMSQFNVSHISASVLEMGANISLILDHFTITAKYRFKGFAKIGFVPIPIYVHGRVTIESKSVNTGTKVSVGFSDDGDLILTEFDYSMDIEDIGLQFKGLTGALITERWNLLMSNIGLKMFRKMEPKIHERIRSRGILGINKALKEMEYDWEMWQKVLTETIGCYFG